MRLIQELKRRNVFKVAAAYIIVGWLFMQAGEVLSPALHLPNWINSALVFFLILGFPLAMFFAWAYEMTPEGLKKEKDVESSSSIATATGQKLNYTIIGLLVVALSYFIWESRFHASAVDVDRTKSSTTSVADGDSTESTGPALPSKKSIAVLPFRNRSANEENAEFFSDGVHDELLTNLSRIKALKVISRTSVMRYRDTIMNLRQIGEELGVANILEGGVQRAGDTVRINVQLIDAATDEHLWAKVYDRQLTAGNIFAIQTEIAEAIAKALEATLSPNEHALLAATPTNNLEAYDNLLMGRQLILRGSWQNLRDAQSYLEKAIELDPQFVPAYVELASSYAHLFETGAVSLQEIKQPWQDAVQSALSLDSNNARAIAARAHFLWRNNRPGVDEAYAKARRLEPANVDIMEEYGQYLRKTFSFDHALQIYLLARELDPVSPGILLGLARIHEARFETDQALELYARMRELDPSNPNGIGPVSGVYMNIGNMVESTRWLFKAMAVDPQDSDLTNWVARAYIDFNDLARARQWLSWIEKNQNLNPMTLTHWAMLNIYAGNPGAAMEFARQTLDEKMSDRWGSDSIAIRSLHIWALDQGKADTALALIRQAHPEIFEPTPRIDAGNVVQAIDTAHLLQTTGQNESAGKLLQSVIAAYAVPYMVSAPWMMTGKAQALALSGDKQAALSELRRQVDIGWRSLWRWDTELNPNFESLRDEPDFQAIVTLLSTDMARQYKEVQAMEATGEIPLPSGDETP